MKGLKGIYLNFSVNPSNAFFSMMQHADPGSVEGFGDAGRVGLQGMWSGDYEARVLDLGVQGSSSRVEG